MNHARQVCSDGKNEFKKQKTIKEKVKDNNKIRSSVKKNAKHTVKLFAPEFGSIKIPSDT